MTPPTEGGDHRTPIDFEEVYRAVLAIAADDLDYFAGHHPTEVEA